MFLTRKQLIFRFVHRVVLATTAAATIFSLYMVMILIFLATN